MSVDIKGTLHPQGDMQYFGAPSLKKVLIIIKYNTGLAGTTAAVAL